MNFISDEQLNSLDKNSMAIIIRSLQSQLVLLDTTNKKLSAQLEASEETSKKLLAQVEALTAQIRLANQRSFGRKSEKADFLDGQMTLSDLVGNVFNEAEVNKDSSPEPLFDEITVSYKRKKHSGKRDEDLSGLPIRVISHTLSEEELAEKFPEGYYELPIETYKRLFMIPETFIADEHQIHVYKSKGSDGTIIRAPRPADVFRNSIATPSLLASIITAKYAKSIPLDRQSKIYKENGIKLESNTLSNWVINSADTYFTHLYNRMHVCLNDSKVIHVDESPCDVMRIDGTKSGKETRMWVYRNRPLRGMPPIVMFDWQPSRKPEHPREFLKYFSGTIVTDGYQVYHQIADERDDLKVAGCWVHYPRTIIIRGEVNNSLYIADFTESYSNNNTISISKNLELFFPFHKYLYAFHLRTIFHSMISAVYS